MQVFEWHVFVFCSSVCLSVRETDRQTDRLTWHRERWREKHIWNLRNYSSQKRDWMTCCFITVVLRFFYRDVVYRTNQNSLRVHWGQTKSEAVQLYFHPISLVRDCNNYSNATDTTNRRRPFVSRYRSLYDKPNMYLPSDFINIHCQCKYWKPWINVGEEWK